MTGLTYIYGRIMSNAGALSFSLGTQFYDIGTPQSFFDFPDEISSCSLFTSSGAISTGLHLDSGFNFVGSYDGIVYGYGSPYDGSFAPDPETNPQVLVKYTMKKNGVVIPNSVRYLTSTCSMREFSR